MRALRRWSFNMNNQSDDFLSHQRSAQCSRSACVCKAQFCHQSSKNSGFSLIEVCILLILISLILTPTVYMLNLYYQRYKEATTQQAVDTASSALMKYALKFGKYPRPADPSLAPGNANFGREAAVPGSGWLDCQDGATPANAICQTVVNTYPVAAPPAVIIGALPFAEIGVPITSVMDENGNFLTYAVTAPLTNTATFNENAGAIDVQNAAGQSIFFVDGNGDGVDDFTMPRAHFIVASNGADGLGAYSPGGQVATACAVAANGADSENCNRDGLFRNNADPISRKRQVALAVGAAHFDDLLFATNSTSSGLWSNTPVTPANPNLGIRDRLGGNVAIGDCGGRTPCVPVSKLDVYGSVRASVQVKAFRFKGRGPDTEGTAWYAVDDPGRVEDGNAATRDGRCTSATACPTVAANGWGGANTPPFLMPSTIGGVPPDLDVTSGYYVDDTAGTHGAFFRGNGIKCPKDMAMTGIFDNDEACNSTSRATPGSIAQTGSCSVLGQYAIGINADGSLKCGFP